MKKFGLICAGLLGAFTLSAQVDAVKEAEHIIKGSDPDFAAAQKLIKPALTDEATKNDPKAWYVAGKIGEGIYDAAYKKQILGNELTAAEKTDAGMGLLDCYNDFLTAIPLDVVVDKKGKSKPGKLTKDMVKTLQNNYQGLKNAGVLLFEAQNYGGAYDVWEMYVTIPDNPILGENAPKADPDTVVGQIMYYQMLSALSANKPEWNKKALDKVEPIIKSGFSTLDLYTYGVEAARRCNDSIMQLNLAKKGYELYGTQNISFIGNIINDRLNAGDMAACESLCKEAVTSTDDPKIKSQLLDILGRVYEQSDDLDKAAEYFRQAIELDPTSGNNYYDLARMYYNKAVALDEKVGEDEAKRVAEVNPMLLEAAKYFEKAYELDENLDKIPGTLYRLYYRLGDGYQQKTEEWKNK